MPTDQPQHSTDDPSAIQEHLYEQYANRLTALASADMQEDFLALLPGVVTAPGSATCSSGLFPFGHAPARIVVGVQNPRAPYDWVRPSLDWTVGGAAISRDALTPESDARLEDYHAGMIDHLEGRRVAVFVRPEDHPVVAALPGIVVAGEPQGRNEISKGSYRVIAIEDPYLPGHWLTEDPRITAGLTGRGPRPVTARATKPAPAPAQLAPGPAQVEAFHADLARVAAALDACPEYRGASAYAMLSFRDLAFRSPAEDALRWLNHGWTPAEVEDCLAGGCPDPGHAAALRKCGVEPREFKCLVTDGVGGQQRLGERWDRGNLATCDEEMVGIVAALRAQRSGSVDPYTLDKEPGESPAPGLR